MSKPLFSRPPWWRMLLVGVLSWLILSYWLLPELNPFRFARIGADAETGAMLAMVRHSMQRIKVAAVDYQNERRAWPKAPIDLYEPDDNGLIVLSMPAPGMVSVRLSGGFDRSTGLNGAELVLAYDASSNSWQCRPGNPAPPEAWLFDECRPETEDGWSAWWFALLLALLLIPISWIWIARFDPVLAGAGRDPKQLQRVPLDRLRDIDWRLRWLFRRKSTLALAGITIRDWSAALHWPEQNAESRLGQLAQRLSAMPTSWPHGQWPGRFELWELPPQFPLALERLLVYLPSPELGHGELLQWLRHQRLSDEVLLVLSPNGGCDLAMTAWASDSNHVVAYANQSLLSQWLLATNAEAILAKLLAAQLPVTRISPYQTRGGITRASGFFGRQQELARILNREPSNYLLVGGRQLGKTSLLKAVERYYQGHPEVACVYVSLRDHRLRGRLAQWVGASADCSLAELLIQMQKQSGKSRLLLLLDECDLFLRDDARAGYPQLSELRSLSEEGQCRFILAGFWDLYEAVALDFASPIRNFGDVIRLGPLDDEACLELATRPIQRLGLQYESSNIPIALVRQCGGRANLVAIVCQHMLERLDRSQRVLSAAQMSEALRSDAVMDALTGWSKLSPVESDNRLDRALVYQVALASIANEQAVGLSDWIAKLAAAGLSIDGEKVRCSVLRLELAYVLRPVAIGGDGETGYRQSALEFSVPIQRAQFTLNDSQSLLASELAALRE